MDEFAHRYRGTYSGSLHDAVFPCYCDFGGYQNELLWAAAWLHKASRRREYREYIKRNEVALGASESINEFGWDNKSTSTPASTSSSPTWRLQGTVHKEYCAGLTPL